MNTFGNSIVKSVKIESAASVDHKTLRSLSQEKQLRVIKKVIPRKFHFLLDKKAFDNTPIMKYCLSDFKTYRSIKPIYKIDMGFERGTPFFKGQILWSFKNFYIDDGRHSYFRKDYLDDLWRATVKPIAKNTKVTYNSQARYHIGRKKLEAMNAPLKGVNMEWDAAFTINYDDENISIGKQVWENDFGDQYQLGPTYMYGALGNTGYMGKGDDMVMIGTEFAIIIKHK